MASYDDIYDDIRDIVGKISSARVSELILLLTNDRIRFDLWVRSRSDRDLPAQSSDYSFVERGMVEAIAAAVDRRFGAGDSGKR